MNPQPLPLALADVLARGDVWRGDTLASLAQETIPSGHPELDAELPGGGWPRGSLTEILVDRGGLGEMSLLLPALARLSAEGGWLALVAPPCLPHAPAWVAAGLALERLVIIKAGRRIGWCVEQLLTCGGFAGVLAWPEANIDVGVLRRLQVAAEGRSAFACLWRPSNAGGAPSPAPLRLALSADPVGSDGALSVRIIKRRGRPVSRSFAVTIPRPQTFIGRNSRAVAGPELSLVATRGPAATPVA